MDPAIKQTADASELPQFIKDVMARLPSSIDRRTGADLISRHLFPISYRTIEGWSLPTRRVNGRALVPTADLFGIAYGKFNAAPVIRGGRQSIGQEKAA